MEDIAYMSSLVPYGNTHKIYPVSHIVGKML